MNALNINFSQLPSYKVLTTSQHDYLHNLISVQSTGRTRSSSAVHVKLFYRIVSYRHIS